MTSQTWLSRLLGSIPLTHTLYYMPHAVVNAKEGVFVLSLMHSSIPVLQSPLFHLPLFICLFVWSKVFMSKVSPQRHPGFQYQAQV